MNVISLIFFFQAEDGIRDIGVTGVQTCALPIYMTSVFVFISGATLLVVSAEKLITHLVGAASGLRIPLFLLAVVFTGVEFDDIALGVGLNLEELSGVADRKSVV